MITTHEGSLSYETTADPALDFFSKAGSLFVKVNNVQSFYQDSETALSLFKKAWKTSEPQTVFKLLLWCRDCRGGSGNRSGSRECFHWLANDPIGKKWISTNLHWIPLIGRWDDLLALYKTPLEKEAAKMWASEIKAGNPLAAKWCDRKNFPVKHALQIRKEGDFRKLLAINRKNSIVEYKMSTKQFNKIAYENIPSLAMARYSNAFQRNDKERFDSYRKALKTGTIKINAKVLFPHDCVRTVLHGHPQIADEQFKALPNYFEETNEKIIVLADTSGSMSTKVSGSVEAIHISQGMALYCSEKIDKDSPFYKKFIAFESESKFVDWSGKTFSEAVKDPNIFDKAFGFTKIAKALNLILKTARFFNLSQDQIPTTLLIISDMQFSVGNRQENNPYGRYTRNFEKKPDKPDKTELQQVKSKFETFGYVFPKIVYWNTNGYAGSPDQINAENTALISGFSPAILKAIFNSKKISPWEIMNKALEKYTVISPK